MLHDIIKKGSVDRGVTVRIIDSADGTPETGVVFNTSGIDRWYRREGAAKVSITEATMAALTTAHADGGFLHISDGIYRLDLPDAAFATGANSVDFGGTVTGMIVIGGRVRLVDVDFEDVVRGGMTALPNAAAEAAGGLFTRGTGAGQINQLNSGTVTVETTLLANSILTSASFAANAITAFALAADVTTEIQTGLATAAALAVVDDFLDTEIADIQARLPAALVSGRIDASVGAMASNVITAAALATDAGAEIADAFLDRDMATGTDSGSPTVRTPRQALRQLRNKVTAPAGILTVCKEDDTTTSWTAVLGTDAGALPIVSIDPA